MSKSNRRDFLIKSTPLLASSWLVPHLFPVMAGTAPLVVKPSAGAKAAVQDQWRYCDKCHSMFFNGFPTKGKCPQGGAHNAYGYMFHLQYDLPENPKAQSAWRFCQKCMSMFWNAQPNKGRCAAGGGHEAQGYQFVLPHDIIPDNNNQDKWRYCDKCRIMFYDVSSPQGSCAAGGTHNAQGYMSTPVVIDGHAYLHLQNQRFTCINLQSGERTWTSQPFGKYCSLVCQQDLILALDERGKLLLIKANPKQFELLDEKAVSDQECWAHLAVCGGRVHRRANVLDLLVAFGSSGIPDL